jgi:hypothetical protein
MALSFPGVRFKAVAVPLAALAIVVVAYGVFWMAGLADYFRRSRFFDPMALNVAATAMARGDMVTLKGPAYPDGEWIASISGFTNKMSPGDKVDWDVDFAMTSKNVKKYLDQSTEYAIALAAVRMADSEGRYRDQDAYLYSTYLTPGGLPIEGFQLNIQNSRIGGPYVTPLDYAISIDPKNTELSASRLHFKTRVQTKLADDFPPGMYRIEMAFFAYVQDMWLKIPFVKMIDRDADTSDIDYESLFFSKALMPPITVGAIKTPRAIWALFYTEPSGGINGALSQEDAPHFALTNRVRIRAKYTLPCRPDTQKCEYAILPDLVTSNRRKFDAATYYTSMFEPDYTRGDVTVEVTRPDGRVDTLGTHRIAGRSGMSVKVAGGSCKYSFDQFGRYRIRMTGHMYDRFGNSYEAGGTYEVWVAYPLTFATGIKPGTPMIVGEHYALSATINPPVPADVTATVRFFPGTHPEDVQESVYHGLAQKFGYFYQDPGSAHFDFPEPGEYLFDIFATYTDDAGRLYMGNMKNASVVMAGQPDMDVHGLHPEIDNLDHDFECTLDANCNVNQNNIYFPYESGDMMSGTGYGPTDAIFQPAMSVSEPSGYLGDYLRRNFPWPLARLSKDEKISARVLSNHTFFPGTQNAFRVYGLDAGKWKDLPLFSGTPKNYSPFNFPEMTRQRGYFYIAVSKPGLPLFVTVCDSSALENWWHAQMGNFMDTIGAAANGDRPGDVYWSVVTALFTDPVEGRQFYGRYGAGASIRERGVRQEVISSPFKYPVALINGADLYIYGGVGPSPGTIFETGAVKGIGSVAVPLAPHEVEIKVEKPDGKEMVCRGRADAIGNYACATPLVFETPGVYRIYAAFWEGAARGACPGSKGGWYNVYCVNRYSQSRIFFDGGIPRMVDPPNGLLICGRVEPPIASGTLYFSLVKPGILMDEGAIPVKDGKFSYQLRPDQFSAEFPNIADVTWPSIPARLDFFQHLRRILRNTFAVNPKQMSLSDTFEFDAFVLGEDENGRQVTAGAKLILRGNRVIIPGQFVDPVRAQR